MKKPFFVRYQHFACLFDRPDRLCEKGRGNC